MARSIAITGKGGTGKTTVAALIIKHLREHASGAILALDADPDANLATVLGIPVEQTIGDLREELLKAIKDFPAGMSKQGYIEAGLHQLIIETEKVDLIVMGRSEGPGCYCYVNNLLRKFADDLTPSYEWMVMDTEAGMEHLSRRTSSQVDALVIVVNESPLSLDCARRIDELTRELPNDIRAKYYVINGAKEKRIEAIRARTEGLDLEYLGHIPYDDALEDLVFRGEPIYGLNGSPAVLKIDEIMARIGEN